MNSVVVDGEVLDFKYKKHAFLETSYYFYIGDISIGTVFNMKRGGWTAVTHKYQKNSMGLVEGFKTRFHASKYLLKINGYWGE